MAHRLPICLPILISLVVLPAGELRAGQNDVIDKFAAIVNGQVILESDIIIEQALYQSPIISEDPGTESLSRQEALDRLVRRTLLLREAGNYQELKVTEPVVNQFIHDIEVRLGGHEILEEMLTELTMSDAELYSRVADHLLINSFVEHRIRSFIPIHRKAIEEYIRLNAGEFGIQGTVTENQLQSILSNDNMMQLLTVFLREKAVNEQLDNLINKLVRKAEIVFPENLPGKPLLTGATNPISESAGHVETGEE